MVLTMVRAVLPDNAVTIFIVKIVGQQSLQVKVVWVLHLYLAAGSEVADVAALVKQMCRNVKIINKGRMVAQLVHKAALK